MKKIITTAILVGLTAVVVAETDPIAEQKFQEYQLQWAKEHFAKQGVPVPDGGVVLKSVAAMSNYAALRSNRARIKKEVATLGYMSAYSARAEQLLNFNPEIKPVNYKASNTDLKPSINDLKMAYTFVGVPENDIAEIIGFSPYLTYLKDQGWVGAIEFFRNPIIGTCAYSENNVRLSHGSIIVAQEDATVDINGKVTIEEVIGNNSAGFLYNVEWYDQTFFRQLECANKQFSDSLKQDVIELAKHIDAAQ